MSGFAHSASSGAGDLPDNPSIIETIKVAKNVSIDVVNISDECKTFVANPITLSLATDTLTLLVHSSVYPNSYPDSLGGLLGDESTLYPFHIVEPSKIDSSVLLNVNNDDDDDTQSEQKPFYFVPQGVGTVILEFYGDVVLDSSNSSHKKKKVTHITVQIPINVVE